MADDRRDSSVPTPVWRVEVEMTGRTTIFVQAESKALAVEAAEALAEPDEFVWDDVDATASPIDGLPPERYWSGGEAGDWVEPNGREQDR